MCFQPVGAPSAVGNKRNTKLIGVLHLLKDDGFYLVFLLWIDREIEFVVHLKDHFRT